MKCALITALLLSGLTATAQTGFRAHGYDSGDKEDVEQRWAVDVHIGGNATRGAAHEGDNVPLYRGGSNADMGLITRFRAEYFLPYTQFGIKLGYEHEECEILEGDASYDLNQLMLGGRWYPFSRNWTIQPYAGADVLWAFNAERGGLNTSVSTGKSYDYAITGHVNMPRFSLGPVVGADIYLFSCIALQFEYSYRFGLDSHYRATFTEAGGRHEAVYHGQTHRHVFSVGLKLTFPFRFTRNDAVGLFDGILNGLLLTD